MSTDEAVLDARRFAMTRTRLLQKQLPKCSRDVSVREKHREILFDWLWDVSVKFHFLSVTYFAAVCLFDRYMHESGLCSQLHMSKLQLFGIACCRVSANLYEHFPPESRDWVYVCGKTYDENQIRRAVAQVCQTLSLDVYYVPNVGTFLHFFAAKNAQKIPRCRFHFAQCTDDSDSGVVFDSAVIFARVAITFYKKVSCEFQMAAVALASLCVAQLLFCGSTDFTRWHDGTVYKMSVTTVSAALECDTRRLTPILIQCLKSAYENGCSILRGQFRDRETFFKRLDRAAKSFVGGDDNLAADAVQFGVPMKVRARRLKLEKPGAHFDILNGASLGKGSYGSVCSAALRDETKRVFALKQFVDSFEEPSVLRELSILCKVKHYCLLPLHRAYCYSLASSAGPNCTAVFDLAENGSLSKYQQKTAPTDAQCARWALQLARALCYLHGIGLSHGDVKPDNVVIDKQFNAKLIDFSLSRFNEAFAPPMKTDASFVKSPARPSTHLFPRKTTELGTRFYRAPELLLGSQRHCPFASDVWAYGLTVAEMKAKEAVLLGECEIDQLFKIFQFLGTPDESGWPTLPDYPHWKSTFPRFCKTSKSAQRQWQKVRDRIGADGVDLVRSCLVYDPSQRPTFDDLLCSNSYFRKLS